MSSKFIIDSMLPKYAQFQPFISPQLSSHNTNNSTSSTTNSLVSAQTPNSEGSPLTTTGSEGSPNSPATSNNKMYPFVSNHPTTHASYSSMPGFSGLDDKSCRLVPLVNHLPTSTLLTKNHHKSQLKPCKSTSK